MGKEQAVWGDAIMPKQEKLRHDENEIAFRTVRAATGQGKKPVPLKAKRGREKTRRGPRKKG